MIPKKIILPLLLIVFTCHQLKADSTNKFALEVQYGFPLHTNLWYINYPFLIVPFFYKTKLAYAAVASYNFREIMPYVAYNSAEYLKINYNTNVKKNPISARSVGYRKSYLGIGLAYNFNCKKILRTSAFFEACIPVSMKETKPPTIIYFNDSTVPGYFPEYSPFAYKIGIINSIQLRKKLDLTIRNYFEQIVRGDYLDDKYPNEKRIWELTGSFLSTSIGLRYKF